MAEYNAVVGASGALSGAATGAAIGSVIPVVGTGIGALVGGVLGLVGGFGGGGSSGLQDPIGVAKRNAISAGLVPPGKAGADAFRNMLVANDPRAVGLFLQAGGNPNKFGAGFFGPGGAGVTQLGGGGGTVEAAAPMTGVCDPRPLQILALLVRALESEQRIGAPTVGQLTGGQPLSFVR